MEELQIKNLIESKIFSEQSSSPVLKETNISWIILAKKYAYKIKKPLQYSFLNFSTLEKRKYYCEREVELNKRLAGKVYLKVIPIFINKGNFSFDKGDGKLIDYAVLMKRMDSTKEMDNLLERNRVSNNAIKKLAKQIACFHQNAIVIKNKIQINDLQQKYNDILTVKEFFSSHSDSGFSVTIQEAVEKSNRFLKKNLNYFKQRLLTGFTRDVHGDLHSGNIFLYKDPIIFDCVEFNDGLRQIDILNEIAFLCMDLEAFHRYDLSKIFYESYMHHSRMKETTESRLFFNYYKSYRANVRAKINALTAMKSADGDLKLKDKNEAEKYLKLLKSYMQEF